jgi:hypothetical protein
MKLNYDDDNEQRKPLKPGALNETKQENETTVHHEEDDSPDMDEKRRKYIKWGIIGGVVTVCVVLAIVLPLTLGGGGKPPGPTPPAPKPVVAAGQNPYYVVISSEKNTGYSRHGKLVFDVNRTNLVGDDISELVSEDTKRILLGHENVGAVSKIAVNWTQSLSIGPNNQIKKSLKYDFDMVNFKCARFQLTDADSDRFSIPDEFVNKPDTNKNMRLDMVGHYFNATEKTKNEPFYFQFRDNLRPENIYVTTENQSLIFSDKYIQMDFALPSD